MHLDQVGRTFGATFDNGGAITISRVRDLPNGDYRAQVAFYDGDLCLNVTMLNLSVGTSRQKEAKALAGRNGKLPWGPMLDEACTAVCARLLKGEPLQIIDTSLPVTVSQYLIEPMLPEKQTTILFARGGRGKSYLAAYLYMVAQAPLKQNVFGWKVAAATPGLYLDWEADQPSLHIRAKRLVRGMEVPDLKINYRRCSRPLADEFDTISQLLCETRAGLLIVDSVGVALGADPSDPGKATAFFGMLRELNTTVLLIHHESKNDMARTKTPFGSVYFENLARSVWHLDKAQEAGANEILLSLEQTKSNDSILHTPIGIAVRFDNEFGKTRIEPVDLEGTAFEDKLPLLTRIKKAIEQSGLMTVAELAEELDKDAATIRARLADGAKKGMFHKEGEKWAVTYQE